MGTSGSLSRIISRTLRADDDRACRALLEGPTEPLLMLTPPGPNPNVVFVGGADGGVERPEMWRPTFGNER